MIQNRAWRFTRWPRKRTLVVLLVATVALLLPALALATQFFSGTLQTGQFASAGSSVTAVSDQTQKNSGSGCALTFFNIVGSNVYQTCSNTTFTVSAQEATGHSPAADPACGARYASVNVTCRYFNGF
jgi:hypothetical protein